MNTSSANSVPSDIDLEKLTKLEPTELIKWTFETFGDRASIGTSFQLTGVTLIDMAHKAGLPFRVFSVDSMRLHRETYDLMENIELRYGVKIEKFRPDPARIKKMIDQHGEYLFFDTKAKQEYCCQIRKVEPHEKALETVDAWITGLRRDQSEDREDTPKVSWIERDNKKILKLCPLVDWPEAKIREYIKENHVPYHPLFDQDYASIGCVICSTPVRPGESMRAGRWRWFNNNDGDGNKECGIHI
ncbi:MAG: phosphoadenylyl-sulfate reductase [Candidatus Lindowbacteria bacterium]|nr:phosphoadenylyl-sulfate reductase [Candidatus Lindowbacteria bacterium]